MLQAVGLLRAEIEPRATALLQWSNICRTGHLLLIHRKAFYMEAATLSILPSPGTFAFLRRHVDTMVRRNDLTLMEIQVLRQNGE